MSEPLYPPYNHTRSDGAHDPCPICKAIQDKVHTHWALISLMSCLEIAASLHLVAHVNEVDPTWHPGCGRPVHGYPPAWVATT